MDLQFFRKQKILVTDTDVLFFLLKKKDFDKAIKVFRYLFLKFQWIFVPPMVIKEYSYFKTGKLIARRERELKKLFKTFERIIECPVHANKKEINGIPVDSGEAEALIQIMKLQSAVTDADVYLLSNDTGALEWAQKNNIKTYPYQEIERSHASNGYCVTINIPSINILHSKFRSSCFQSLFALILANA